MKQLNKRLFTTLLAGAFVVAGLALAPVVQGESQG